MGALKVRKRAVRNLRDVYSLALAPRASVVYFQASIPEGDQIAPEVRRLRIPKL